MQCRQYCGSPRDLSCNRAISLAHDVVQIGDLLHASVFDFEIDVKVAGEVRRQLAELVEVRHTIKGDRLSVTQNEVWIVIRRNRRVSALSLIHKVLRRIAESVAALRRAVCRITSPAIVRGDCLELHVLGKGQLPGRSSGDRNGRSSRQNALTAKQRRVGKQIGTGIRDTKQPPV